jgi:A/G-specific adenine glycosylase
MQLTQQQIDNFQKKIYDHYKKHGRIFIWRKTSHAYHIFISEVMLQQTQTIRVTKKYKSFVNKFPDFKTLAHATLYEVLKLWQGLGYNRRAKFLHQSAKIITKKYNGLIPKNPKLLQMLPGIGQATAASICAFAFNMPTVFVETNIRVVFINEFLKEKEKIEDTKLLSLAKQTLDISNPRIWYYAITDYGAMLKSKGINPINKSKAYTKQSKFAGSDRQIRGEIIKLVLKDQNISQNDICKKIKKILHAKPDKIKKIINRLIDENLIVIK